MEDDQIIELAMKFDADGGGTIDFVEFLAMMVSGDKDVCSNVLSHVVNFREAFTLFDDDDSGFITPEEYVQGLRVMGQGVTLAEVQAAMNEIDQD